MSKGSGCGCKIAPAVLSTILAELRQVPHSDQLLVGLNASDDAAVFDTGDGRALISTTDFFTPVVDDPYTFGQIAAANAISDVYAMGGRPVMAVSILGWPVEKLAPALAARVLAGAQATCAQANVALAGGHSIDASEPFFGLAVTGTAETAHIKRNNTVREGDLLFITKPLGSGIIAAAHKKNMADAQHMQEAVEWMTTLNQVGEVLGQMQGVTAMTDVTGFGLIGHLMEMLKGNNLSAEIDFSIVPRMNGIEDYVAKYCFPDNVYRNWNAYEHDVEGITGMSFVTLCDPQTNGGLMVALRPEAVEEFTALMKNNEMPVFATLPIGKVIARAGKPVVVLNG